MQNTQDYTSEVAILSRMVQPEKPGMSLEAARAILALDFIETDKDRMRQLSAKAREGTLTEQEQAEINNYKRIGHFLGFMQSKARCSLKDD